MPTLDDIETMNAKLDVLGAGRSQGTEDAHLDLGVAEVGGGQGLEARVLGGRGDRHLGDRLVEWAFALQASNAAPQLAVEVQANEGAALRVKLLFRSARTSASRLRAAGGAAVDSAAKAGGGAYARWRCGVLHPCRRSTVFHTPRV